MWSFRLGSGCGNFFFFGLRLGYLSVSKLGPHLSVLQSYWSVHVWNWKDDASGCWARSQVILVFCSSVLRGLYFLVSVVSRRTSWPSSLLRLLGAASAGVGRLLSLIIILGSTVGCVGSWTASKTTTCGFLEHSTCGCLGIVKDPSVAFRRIVLMLTLYLSVSQEDQQHY